MASLPLRMILVFFKFIFHGDLRTCHMVHYYLLSIMLLKIENKRLHGAYILAGFAIQRE